MNRRAWIALCGLMLCIGGGIVAASDGTAWWAFILGAGAAFWLDDLLKEVRP